MTYEEWAARELAKRPPRSEEWKKDTRRLWGLKPVADTDLAAIERDEMTDKTSRLVDWYSGGGAVIVQGGPRTRYLIIDTHPPHKYTAISKPPVEAPELARLKSLAPNPNGWPVILYCRTHDRVAWYPSQGMAKEAVGVGRYCDQCQGYGTRKG